ncbi:hypothetical protein [Paratissierella segnis]|uniref:Uncharacterized protein n=1 Tax=Paratissierella segnis TaxID=2763679 RepID=A0A926EV33_9FIRM|nr:hypothetical protein [Paratissierella segnis]MBC8588062.1 hypothetical protein [Paratissierella segnis]
MEAKKCKICGEKYPETSEYFYKRRDYKNGLDTTCKFCRRKEDAERRERLKANTKKCSQCGKDKPLNEDNFDKLKVVYRSVCKSCRDKNKKKHLETKQRKKKEIEQFKKEKRERDIQDEKAFRKMISQPRTKGLADKEFDYPLTIGKKYKVIKLALREGQTRTNETFQGELTQITDNFFVLKNKVGFCECFLKNDYKLGEIKILEV